MKKIENSDKNKKSSPMKASTRGISGTYDTLILCETVVSYK